MRNLPPWFNIENWEKDLHIKEHVMMEQIKNLGLIEKYKNDELKDLDVKKLVKIINSNYMLGELADKFKINRKDFLIFFNDKFNLNIKSLEKTIAKDKIISLLKDNPEIYSGKFKLPDPIKDNTFLIDGLNICYGFSKAKKQISIKYLLTLVKEIIIHGGQFICVFDKDTFTQFKCLNPSEIKYVKEVVSKAKCQFGMVKGKLVADDVLLNRVENDNHFIISHDKYVNYKKKYAVLYAYPNKFKQFTLFYEKRNGRIVELISVPRLGILKPVRNDLEKLTKEILTLLRREPCQAGIH